MAVLHRVELDKSTYFNADGALWEAAGTWWWKSSSVITLKFSSICLVSYWLFFLTVAFYGNLRKPPLISGAYVGTGINTLGAKRKMSFPSPMKKDAVVHSPGSHTAAPAYCAAWQAKGQRALERSSVGRCVFLWFGELCILFPGNAWNTFSHSLPAIMLWCSLSLPNQESISIETQIGRAWWKQFVCFCFHLHGNGICSIKNKSFNK